MSLACTPPVEKGRRLLRWTTRELAALATDHGVVPGISHSTVWRILDEAELHPHKLRYWLHSQDPQFASKAASVLWYYERASGLASQGVLVVCLDEKPGIQALERRCPDVRVSPGRPTLREFEYVRHGVVGFELALVVSTGQLWHQPIEHNDAPTLISNLEVLCHEFREAQRIELILDNASSHTAAATAAWLDAHRDRIRVHFTPTHASWLNQAELALSAVSRRYLRGASVTSREDLLSLIDRGIREYNERYAHPFEWSFTRHAMREWYQATCGERTHRSN